MKVKIEIDATIMYCEYCNVNYADEWSEYCNWYYYILKDINVLANGEDITKKKGKYVMVENLVRNAVTGLDHDLPIEFRPLCEAGYSGRVELDVDNFDPKKLQLRKCTYEFDNIPYAIDAYHILYDGELIEIENDYSWGYIEDEVDEDLFFEID